MPAPVRLVYAYAPSDELFREQLSVHLHPLVQKGLLSEWHEQLIPAGSNPAQERQKAWQSADIVLLLLSADYFASDAFDPDEIEQALGRHRSGHMHVIPLLLRPCDWQSTLVADVQPLPRNGKPVTLWENRDDALFSVVQDLRRLIPGQQPTTASGMLTAEQRTNRQRLLKRVHTIWIDGLLQQSLQHVVWVDLHLQKQPDAVDNPWRLMVQELDREPRPLPPDTSILQVLDEADEELLILGDPGAGKTTLLLYLARTLLERAERDEHRRMPVVFNLSSWAQQRLPLQQWLVEELALRYQVPRKIGQAWLEANQIFPLLDGLDEVAESARAACVQAIISFAQQSSERTPLVICCRTEEYQALSARLPLQYAIMLLPFSDDQIDVYLSSVSGNLDALRQVLREDKDLFELAHRPLMLSIFAQAYHDEAAIDLPTAPAAHDEYPRALFRQYVKHMLTRRAQLQQGTEEQTHRWLTYFATQLYRQQQTLFAVEELQPSWLPEKYQALYRWAMTLTYGLTFGLVGGPIFCLTFGLVFGLISHSLNTLLLEAIFGLVLGLVGGAAGGLFFGLAFRHHQTIHPAEITAWSWSTFKRGLLIGLAGGFVFGLVGGLIGWVLAGPTGGIALWIALICVIGLVGGLVGGLSPMQMPERVLLSPNEGIWRSGRRGLIAVLLFAVIVGLGAGLIVSLFGSPLHHNVVYGLLLGLILGSGTGLVFGLAFNLVGGRTGIAAFLQHFVLRLFLWRLGLLPWKLVVFLDELAARLLLRKVGGSYIFVHRLLRDVLATDDAQG